MPAKVPRNRFNPCFLFSFLQITGDQGQYVGSLRKQFSGVLAEAMSIGGDLNLCFDPGMKQDLKLLLIAASILADYASYDL